MDDRTGKQGPDETHQSNLSHQGSFPNSYAMCWGKMKKKTKPSPHFPGLPKRELQLSRAPEPSFDGPRAEGPRDRASKSSPAQSAAAPEGNGGQQFAAPEANPQLGAGRSAAPDGYWINK